MHVNSKKPGYPKSKCDQCGKEVGLAEAFDGQNTTGLIKKIAMIDAIHLAAEAWSLVKPETCTKSSLLSDRKLVLLCIFKKIKVI